MSRPQPYRLDLGDGDPLDPRLLTMAEHADLMFQILFEDLAAVEDSVSTIVVDDDDDPGVTLPIDLTTDVTGVLPIANGGTNAATAADARTNLGVVPGTDVFTQRTITGGTGVNVTNGDGVAGNPTIQVDTSYFKVAAFETTLTIAQVRAMSVTPITVVPAQGANTYIYPINWTLSANISGALSASTTHQLQFAGSVTNLATSITFLWNSATKMVRAGLGINLTTQLNGFANTAVQIANSAALTGGTFTADAKVYVTCLIVTQP